MLLDDVIDVRHGRGNEKGEYESNDVVAGGPEMYVNRIEDAEDGESPRDSVDDHRFCMGGGELVNDCAKEEEVDEGPKQERPVCGGQVGLFAAVIDARRGGNRVEI